MAPTTVFWLVCGIAVFESNIVGEALFLRMFQCYQLLRTVPTLSSNPLMNTWCCYAVEHNLFAKMEELPLLYMLAGTLGFCVNITTWAVIKTTSALTLKVRALSIATIISAIFRFACRIYSRSLSP